MNHAAQKWLVHGRTGLVAVRRAGSRASRASLARERQDQIRSTLRSSTSAMGGMSLRAFASSSSTTTTCDQTPATTMPSWPPRRSQMVKYEEDFDERNSGDVRGVEAIHHHAGGRVYLDDHHFVSEADSAASKSPHHDDYGDQAVQRVDIFKIRAEELRAAGFHGVSEEDEEMDWSAKVMQKKAKEEKDASSQQGGGKKGQAVAAAAAKGKEGIPAAGGGNGEGDNWSWAKPQQTKKAAKVEIPVIPRKLLSEAEVVQAMESLGGMDIKVVSVVGKGNLDSEAMVFISGRSGGHLRRMADTLVYALKKRKIGERQAPGVTGAEGYDCDDWMIVDCGNLIVHLMDPLQRKALDLETHWSSDSWQQVTMPVTTSEAGWEAAYEKVVDAHPAAEAYDPFKDDNEKRERELRRVLNRKGSK